MGPYLAADGPAWGQRGEAVTAGLGAGRGAEQPASMLFVTAAGVGHQPHGMPLGLRGDARLARAFVLLPPFPVPVAGCQRSI